MSYNLHKPTHYDLDKTRLLENKIKELQHDVYMLKQAIELLRADLKIDRVERKVRLI